MSTFTMGGVSRYPDGGKFATATADENIVPTLAGQAGAQTLRMARIITKEPATLTINGQDWTTEKADSFNGYVAEKHGVCTNLFGNGPETSGTIRSIIFSEPVEFRAEYEI